jgi:hypothetical protein
MKKQNLLLCAALTLGATFTAFAGTQQTVTFTATVPNVLELQTTSNSAGITLTAADFTSADSITTQAAAAHALSVRSNRAWIVSAKSGTANFTFTPSIAGDTRTKPASDLNVRKAGGTYQALSTTNVQVATGGAGGVSTPGNSFSIDYKLATDITVDPPGSYVLDVVYTLTAP